MGGKTITSTWPMQENRKLLGEQALLGCEAHLRDWALRWQELREG